MQHSSLAVPRFVFSLTVLFYFDIPFGLIYSFIFIEEIARIFHELGVLICKASELKM